MPLFRPLDQISLKDLAECGGKAARLGEAMRLGCPILPGIVLSTELYRRFMLRGGLQGEIASILTTMQPKTITHFQAAEWAIQAAFRVRRMPDEIARAIREAWQALDGVPVAVRSSATNEDSPEQSFVGQHATCLGVESEEAAIEAVLGCWMSLFSAKALSYARRFGVDLINSSMAVLMQPMISLTSRGALFTVDPITGNPDVFVLEVRDGPEAGIHLLDPYERQPGELPFWSQLRHLGLLLDEHELRYQAIEWAIDEENQLYLLRVRPTTSVPSYLPLSGANLGAGHGPIELVRQPNCSPRATRPYSWYHRSRSPRLNAAYFKSAHRLFARYSSRDEFYPCGYLYARWRRFSAAPFDEGLGPLPRFWYSLLRLYAARTLDREFRALWRKKRPRLDILRRRDLSSLSSHELGQHLQEVMVVGDAFWEQCGHLGNSDEALRDILCRLHERWLGDTSDCDALLWTGSDQLTRCHEGLCELARTECADEASGLAEEGSQEEISRIWSHHGQTALARYRHLFLYGQPLTEWQDICALQEDENAIRAALARWMQDDSCPQCTPSLREQNARRAGERDIAEHRALGRLGRVKHAIYRHVLRVARRYAPLCVDCREPVLLCRLLERDTVLEVGRRLQLEGLASKPEEACQLGFRQIIDWLEGATRHDELVHVMLERKGQNRRWWRYSPPDILTNEVQSPTIDVGLAVPPEDVLRGQAISPGLTRGRARVVNTLGETTNVLPGEVLICREPLFELSPMFSIVAAVVAETGGLLDHASVLAREYGVPAIFGVQGATERIRTGEDLFVDANNGVIVRHRTGSDWDSLWAEAGGE